MDGASSVSNIPFISYYKFIYIISTTTTTFHLRRLVSNDYYLLFNGNSHDEYPIIKSSIVFVLNKKNPT